MKNLYILLMSIIVFLLAMETLLIIFAPTGPDPTSKVIGLASPGNTVRHYIYRTRLNNEGFRGQDFKTEKNNNTRIAVIGDSFTFGVGLEEEKETYPGILQNMLGKNYEVMNFGMSGANILDIYWILKHKVDKYDPDIIIYAYSSNDPEFLDHNIPLDSCYIITGSVRIRSLEFFSRRLRYTIMNSLRPLPAYYLHTSLNPGWKCTKRLLPLYSEYSDRMIVFMVPDGPYSYRSEFETKNKIYTEFEKNNISTLDGFLMRFRNRTQNMTEKDMRIDMENNEFHYNEITNSIIAETLYPYIIEYQEHGPTGNENAENLLFLS